MWRAFTTQQTLNKFNGNFFSKICSCYENNKLVQQYSIEYKLRCKFIVQHEKMMMIVLVILVYFNGLLVSSEGNYLPFLYPTDYSILNVNDYYSEVSLPSPLNFGSSFCLKCVKVKTA